MINSLRAASVAAALTIAAGGSAQSPSSAGRIPSPSDKFGFQMGADHKLIDWGQVTRYFRELDSLSPRVAVEELGKSTLGKPFIMAVISSEETIAGLDRYKSMQRALAHPAGSPSHTGGPDGMAGKAVVLITLNIHSTEIASSQESVELAHELATLETPIARKIRDSVIVLLVPSLNPDGQQIVTDWYRKTAGTSAEGSSPPELYHHYAGHDNNRDWFMYNLAESRHTAKVLYHEWFPEIVFDQHQMGSSGPRLFLPPYEDPVNPNVPAALTAQVNLLGKYVVADLHRQGFRGVATGTVFNAYFEGTMSKTPLWHNRIGILSEAASAQIATPIFFPEGSVRGLGSQLPENKTQTNYLDPWNGGWWRVRDIIEYEKAATYSLLDFAATFSARIKSTFTGLNSEAISRGAAGETAAYLISPDQHDPGAAIELVNRLLISGVAVEQYPEGLNSGGAAIPAGSFVIPLAQPARSYVVDLMERQVYPELLEYPGGPPRTPYDVTAWTLPMMMGVDVLPLGNWSAVGGRVLRWDFGESGAGAAAAQFLSHYPAGPGLRRIAPDGSTTGTEAGVSGSRETSGGYYVIERSHTAAHAVAHELLRRGEEVFELRSLEPAAPAADPGSAAVPALPAGTFLVRANTIGRSDIAAVAAKWNVPLFGADSVAGTLRRVWTPRIAVYQPWVTSMDEGWTRLVLDTLGIQYRTIHNKDVGKGSKLGRSFDVIILADISTPVLVDGKWSSTEQSEPVVETPEWPEEYRGGIGAEGVDALKEFIKAGGTIIAMGASVDFAIDKLRVPAVNLLKDLPSKDFYAPGTIVRLTVDPEHPLAYGMPARAEAYITDNHALRLLPYRHQSAIVSEFAGENLLSSGWMVGANRMEGTVAMAEIPYGKGRVVLYGFRVQHRAQTHGTFKLLLNALLW